MWYILAIFLFLGTQSSAQSRGVRDLLPEGSFTKGMEGPSFDANGNLYAVNYQKQGTIGVIDKDGNVSLYVSLPYGSVGNGIRFGKDGFMYVADYTGHNILKIDPSNRSITVFAHEPKMNQPNDLAISMKTGIIYASDPNWSDSTGKLWIVKKDGTVVLVEDGMGTTNGIEVNSEGTLLYVNESVQRKVWVYDINHHGIPVNKRLFYEFEDYGMDGMRCDSKGNLYIIRHGKGSVVKISPKGRLVREYYVKGKNTTNIAIDKNERRAYITVADRGCFEVIKL